MPELQPYDLDTYIVVPTPELPTALGLQNFNDVKVIDAVVAHVGDDARHLPEQSGHAGKWLSTDGTSSSWSTLDTSGNVDSVNGQTGVVVLDADDLDEGSTNLYYTDTRVSANADVAANTAARHAAATIGSAANGLSLLGQQISLTAATTSAPGAMSAADKLKLDGVEAGAQTNDVVSVDGRTGAVTLSDIYVPRMPSPNAGNVATVSAAGGVEDSLVALSTLATDAELSAHAGNAAQHVPSQSGHAGKYLSTDGSATSWASVSAGATTLDGLTDVETVTPVADDVLAYVGGAWTNRSTLQAANVPDLDAAKIATGTLAAARLGTGTASAASYLRGDGTWQSHLGHAVTRVSSGNTTLADTDGVVLCNSAQTVTINPANLTNGRHYTIKRIGSATVTLSMSSGTIEGSSTYSLTTTRQSVIVTRSGADCHICASHNPGGAL